MTGKVVKMILGAIEKFLGKIVIVRRGYEENLQGRGFHTMRWYCFLSTFVVLGDDSAENKKKVDNTGKKLTQECERQVREQRSRTKDKMKRKKRTE